MILKLREGDFELVHLKGDENVGFILKRTWNTNPRVGHKEDFEPTGVHDVVPWGIGSFLILAEGDKAIFVPAIAAKNVMKTLKLLSEKDRLESAFVLSQYGIGLHKEVTLKVLRRA